MPPSNDCDRSITRTAPGSSNEVHVIMTATHCEVYLPADVDPFTDALFTVSFQPTFDEQVGCLIYPRRTPLYRSKSEYGKHYYTIPAGLWPVTRELLVAAGYSPEVFYHRPKLALDSWTPVELPYREEGYRASDSQWLSLVREHDRGLVRYCRGSVDPYWLIVQVALAWPDLTILVVVDTKRERSDLLAELQTWRIKDRLCRLRNEFHGTPPQQLIVMTSTNMSGDAEFQTRQIVIVLNAGGIANKRLWDASRYFHAARVFGLIPQSNALCGSQEDFMRAVFGFREVHLVKHGQLDTTHDVVSVRFRGGSPELSTVTSAYEVKVRGLWRNDARNRFIGGLARRILRLDLSLNEGHPVLYDKLRGIPHRRIGIVVEPIDHACELSINLERERPVLFAGTTICAERLRQHDWRFISLEPYPDWRVCLITLSNLPAMGQCDLVIRADGTAGVSNILNVKGIMPPLTVDIRDDYHPRLRGWGRERRQGYLAAGCILDGTERTEALIQQWMEDRPDVKQREVRS